MTDIELFETLKIPYQSINGEINAKTCEDFIEQFRKIFSAPAAKGSRRVVYIWSTNSSIPRMKGESNVIYIGKTIASLYERHYRYAKVEGSDLNWEKHKYIIAKFGSITVRYAICDDPRKAEKDLLQCYLREHLEFPPKNSSG